MMLGFDRAKAALLAIDCQRGHLDPKVATMPLGTEAADRLIAANQRLMSECRARAIPVVHALTRYRDAEEIAANPFWRTRHTDPGNARSAVLLHNLDGAPGAAPMSQLKNPADRIVDRKTRDDAFHGTGLDGLLRAHGINTLIVSGVGTNSAVLATAAAAHVRDYAVIVAADAVDTLDAPSLHRAALDIVAAGFGWVMATDDILALELSGVPSEAA